MISEKTMMHPRSASVSEEEVARFSAQAEAWWDPHGAFRALHDMEELRTGYIASILAQQTGLDVEKGKGPLKKLHVLDVGCGGGLLAEPMARWGAVVTGVDASAEAIRVAQAHAAASNLRIDYRHGTAEDLARAGEQYDVITAFEIVEHVADLASFMTALSRLLKPDGLLLIATMNRTKRSFLLGVVMAEYVLGLVPSGTHDWDKFVKPSEMVNLWEGLGIEALDVTGVAYRPLSRSFGISKGKAAVNYFMAGKKHKKLS